MKNVKYILFALVAVLSSCENFYMEKQLGHNSDITDIRGFSYVLDAADYATIAANAANKALALRLDSDSTVYRQLQLVATEKAFNDIASADMFVPAFIAAKYPQLSLGSQCNITYQQSVGKSFYQRPFASATAYTLTDDDYKSIWGGRGALYLAPSAEDQLPAFLLNKFPSAAEDKIIVVTYVYSEQEPDTIYPPLPYECSIADLLEAKETVEHQLTGTIGKITSNISGRFYLVDGIDSILVYGIKDENGASIWRDLGLTTGDRITVKGRYSDESGEPQFTNAVYVSSQKDLAPARILHTATQSKSVVYQLQGGEWKIYSNDQVNAVEMLPEQVYAALGTEALDNPQLTVNTYLKNKYPYAAEGDDYLVVYRIAGGVTADDFIFNGTDFMMNIGVEEETMSFLLKPEKGWVADVSTFLNEPFIGHGQGDFVIQNVALDGLSYVWLYSALYGMKASAYAGNSNHPTESWLVSPAIKLKKAVNPALIFEQTQKYAANFATECTVQISTDYAGDVTTCSWTQLPWGKNADGSLNVPDGGSWTFISSGELPLTDYIGQTIYIAFKYTSSATASATWEVKNVLVHELDAED
ncbi:MAG: choice-of-anchor J domain-containing protein [Paludibacteraceae bacterium]|nr:choice-of-anchor J domain-containing protein [Paludibacteraceae bacterium]